MQQEVDTRQLRSFGLTVGGVFALISIWPAAIHSQTVRAWPAILAALLIIPALVFPRSLNPIYHGWMGAGHALGWINTRIVLGTVFYALLLPMALLMRLSGRDPMRRRFEPGAGTYRLPRQPRPPSHMKHQF